MSLCSSSVVTWGRFPGPGSKAPETLTKCKHWSSLQRTPESHPRAKSRAPRSKQGTGPTTDFHVMPGNLTDRQCKSGCAPRMLLSLGKQDHLSPVGRKRLQRQLVPALLEPPAKPFLHHGNFCLLKWRSSVTPRGLRRLSWLRSPQMGPESLGTWGALGPGLRDSLGGEAGVMPFLR